MDERVDVSKPPSWKFILRKNPREIGGFFLPKNGWRMDRKEREMDIVNLKLSEIKPYENNPRYNDDAVDKVEWGNCTPKILSAKWKKGEGDGGKEENGKT